MIDDLKAAEALIKSLQKDIAVRDGNMKRRLTDYGEARAQIVALEKERDEIRTGYANYLADVAKASESIAKKIAALTAERDELRIGYRNACRAVESLTAERDHFKAHATRWEKCLWDEQVITATLTAQLKAKDAVVEAASKFRIAVGCAKWCASGMASCSDEKKCDCGYARLSNALADLAALTPPTSPDPVKSVSGKPSVSKTETPGSIPGLTAILPATPKPPTSPEAGKPCACSRCAILGQPISAEEMKPEAGEGKACAECNGSGQINRPNKMGGWTASPCPSCAKPSEPAPKYDGDGECPTHGFVHGPTDFCQAAPKTPAPHRPNCASLMTTSAMLPHLPCDCPPAKAPAPCEHDWDTLHPAYDPKKIVGRRCEKCWVIEMDPPAPKATPGTGGAK